jgi:hypothetical protein
MGSQIKLLHHERLTEQHMPGRATLPTGPRDTPHLFSAPDTSFVRRRVCAVRGIAAQGLAVYVVIGLVVYAVFVHSLCCPRHPLFARGP